ncbi:cyclic beta 1-2 glucan synthase [Klebsiella variicola]|uniref:Cyclic beta 1-2 glucan synthase n=1 Tax=Klebsiella variicola TaxID=244366 RepID=A0A7H4MIM1_KLEVA|nr:cyclic beta 1-2 glucan synthase [Klebsiella variicola]
MTIFGCRLLFATMLKRRGIWMHWKYAFLIWRDARFSLVKSLSMTPPVISGTEETLWLHCVKAIHYGLRFGEHGLPLMGAGDWNDGMNRGGGIEGKGESVWLGFFLYDILQRFAALAERRLDESVARCAVHRLYACKVISKPTPGMGNGTGAGILTMVLPWDRKPHRTAGLMRLRRAGLYYPAPRARDGAQRPCRRWISTLWITKEG